MGWSWLALFVDHGAVRTTHIDLSVNHKTRIGASVIANRVLRVVGGTFVRVGGVVDGQVVGAADAAGQAVVVGHRGAVGVAGGGRIVDARSGSGRTVEAAG